MPGVTSELVLIAVADATVRAALHEALRPLAAEVLMVASGTDALDMLAGRPVGVLFLDPRLPDVDGLALLEKLEREHSRVRAYVVVKKDDAATANEAARHGAAGVLTWPVDDEDLREALTRE